MFRFVKIASTVAILLLVAAISIPNLLSISYVKQRIASQLSELTGRTVSLNGSSTVSLRPYLGVSYRDVTISDARDGVDAPLVTMEGFRARLGLLAALWGDAQLTELEFVRPQFNLRINQSGEKNWLPDSGLLGKALDQTAGSDTSPIDLGTVKIVDGKLKIDDEINRTTNELTSISGTFSWSNTNGEASAVISAVWRGEVTNTTAYADNFAALLQGQPTSIALKFLSKPFNISFDGKITNYFEEATGAMNASSPSPKRLAEWLEWRMTATNGFDSSSVSGDMTYKSGSVEFPEATIEIGENQGRGRIQFKLANTEIETINGTLAFTSLDLPDIASILIPNTAGSEASLSQLPNFGEFVADIRLSAQSANSGSIAFEDLAAAILVRDGMASFDIGAARAIDGMIAGSISLKSENNLVETATDLAFSDIDLSLLSKRFLGTGFSLDGKGNVTLKVKSSAGDAAGLMSRLNGEGSLTSKGGSLIGLDFKSLYEESSSGSDAVARISNAQTSYNKLELNFFVANGTAFLRNSTLEGADISLSVSGRSDLVRQSLALRGKVQPTSVGDDSAPALPFFIGGVADAPLIVPLPAAIGIRPKNEETGIKQP